jgi:hypothetical protein
MGTERIIVEELASISMTLTELLSITRIINGEIKNEDFTLQFNGMVNTLASCYDVVISNLLGFSEIQNEESFNNKFESLHAAYTLSYLNEISKPRTYAELAYEAHLELKRMKQSKTSFPLLKRTFIRLDELIDKWADNDVWLAMSIDNLFKRFNHLLNEIAEIKKIDVSDAYIIYHSAFTDFTSYIEIIIQKRDQLPA